jgi:hypothetical protein
MKIQNILMKSTFLAALPRRELGLSIVLRSALLLPPS